MKKVCDRLLNFVQVIDHKGTVRLCGWLNDNVIGALSCQGMKEIYHGRHACELREKLAGGDYTACIADACPYLAMNNMESHLADFEETPEYPEELHLAFEQVCNYGCTSCTVPQMMRDNRAEDLEGDYDVIEERLREVLPHVKRIGANGCGELFVSRRILKLLAEWKPLAPAEEVAVVLETNGSLFDQEHWKQIENLGQYHLSVAVTVMSFDEAAYQFLSGTRLPIAKIEENLRFIKSLREQGIVNYFEIATVVQERNFRFLPEFARRCVEEFGVDYVRLRPYMPWGAAGPEAEWFADIRNPRHPYYREYKEIMKDEIFCHPLVHDWSGGRDSEHSKEFPGSASYYKEQAVADVALNAAAVVKNLRDRMEGEKIAVYGLGNIGKVLVKELQRHGIQPEYILDRYKPGGAFLQAGIRKPEEISLEERKADLIITTLTRFGQISEELRGLGYTGRLIWIGDLLSEETLTGEMRQTFLQE